MMMAKQFQVYQNNAVNTASGPQLTMMLYNGCIKFIKQAMIDMDKKDYENKNINIQKAQNIISELMITLDPNVAISKEFLSLYDFINYQLTEGNVKNEKSYLETALEFVIDFRDMWKNIMKQEVTVADNQGQEARV